MDDAEWVLNQMDVELGKRLMKTRSDDARFELRSILAYLAGLSGGRYGMTAGESEEALKERAWTR